MWSSDVFSHATGFGKHLMSQLGQESTCYGHNLYMEAGFVINKSDGVGKG